MTRATLLTGNRTEVTKSALRMCYLCEIVLPSVTLRAATGDRDVVCGGNTYLGNAKFRGFGGITETSDLKARRISIELSGVSADLISAAMADKYHYAQISLYAAFFDANWATVAEPHQLGVNLYTSTMSISLMPGGGSISVDAESLEVLNRRTSIVMGTPENQKRRYAGDTGMDRVRIVAETEFEWGGSRVGGANSGGVGVGRGPNSNTLPP